MNSNHSHPKQGFDPEGDGPDDRPPSKSMLKRAMHELQDLGEQLLAMPDARLKAIEMPERLRDALDGGRMQAKPLIAHQRFARNF